MAWDAGRSFLVKSLHMWLHTARKNLQNLSPMATQSREKCKGLLL